MKILVRTLIALTLVASTVTPAAAQPPDEDFESIVETLGPRLERISQRTGRWRGNFCQGEDYGENAKPRDGLDLVRRYNVRLVRCVFAKFAPAHVDRAVQVMLRESGGWSWAHNRGSNCRGLFQHMYRYWPSRVSLYLKPRWFGPKAWPPSPFDPRANAIAAARMVAAGGWGPWSREAP